MSWHPWGICSEAPGSPSELVDCIGDRFAHEVITLNSMPFLSAVSGLIRGKKLLTFGTAGAVATAAASSPAEFIVETFNNGGKQKILTGSKTWEANLRCIRKKRIDKRRCRCNICGRELECRCGAYKSCSSSIGVDGPSRRYERGKQEHLLVKFDYAAWTGYLYLSFESTASIRIYIWTGPGSMP